MNGTVCKAKALKINALLANIGEALKKETKTVGEYDNAFKGTRKHILVYENSGYRARLYKPD